jgi:flagellin
MGAGVVVNTNISSLHAARVLSQNRTDLESAMARLASGKRLNSASDDAAAASVAAKMKADIRSTDVAVRNINDGISLFQTVDGASAEVENILIRMRELAVQMTNGTYADADRVNANKEFEALTAEIERIATKSAFNRVAFAGGDTTGIKIQSGAAEDDNLAATELTLPDLRTAASSLAVSAAAIDSATAAAAAVTAVDAAIVTVAGFRADTGATINRLGFALSNAQNVSQRLQEALSGLEDADYAAESAALARGMVLAQAGSAMLAQANQAPQYVLTLLRG